ncbi:MAG: IS110 family transposase [Polyangiaceae bacterium]
MRKVALDLGARKTTFCEVEGEQVLQRGAVTELGTLSSLLGPSQPPAVVAIEACREAWYVHDLLTRWGNQVVLVDTTRSKQLGIGRHGRKTDRIDAEVLALALERGGIPMAHVLSPQRRELRRWLNVRRALVESRAQMVTTARGLAREHGTKLPRCTAEHFASTVTKQRLDLELGSILLPLLTLLNGITAELKTVEAKLLELCATEPVVELLATTPGVGLIVAASFVSVIDDAKRFRTAHQVESYLGLVPSEDSSGGKRRIGNTKRKGNKVLAPAHCEPRVVAVKTRARSDPLRLWVHEVAQRRGRRVAVIALARRLVGILWAMWRGGTVYDPEHLARASDRGAHHRAARSAELRAKALAAAARNSRRRLQQNAGGDSRRVTRASQSAPRK